MQTLIAQEGKWLYNGKDYTQSIYAPDDVDLSQWVEVEETLLLCTNEMDKETYEKEVVRRVRTKYSIDEELAILRQRESKPQEFQEYYDFVEQVKEEARVYIATLPQENSPIDMDAILHEGEPELLEEPIITE